MSLKVSVIILTWNQLDFTRDCLRSLFRQDFNDFEVIVVDNASTDNTVDFIRKNYPQIKLIVNKKNLGFAEGNNVGVRKAKGEYIVLLNNDTTVAKNWLSELVNFMDLHKDTAIAMSKIYDKYGKGRFTFDYETINPLGYPVKYNFDTRKKNWPFFAKGCSLIFRKRKIGTPFDKDYFLYAEDTYLSWKTRIEGCEIKMCMNSVVKHHGEVSSRKIKSMKNYYMEKNRLMNYFIFYSWKNIVVLFPWMLFSIIFHNLYDPKNAGYRFKGYLWVLKNFSCIMKKRKLIQKSRSIKDSRITRYMSRKFFDEKSVENMILKSILSITNVLFYVYTRITFL